MMPSTVNHMKSELSRVLKMVFNSPKLVTELLKEEDKEVAASFITTYVDVFKDGKKIKDGKDIPVITNFAQGLKLDQTLILVGAGEGKMYNSSIGQKEGEFNYNSLGSRIERVIPGFDGKNIILKMSKPVGDILQIDELGVDDSRLSVEGDRIIVDMWGASPEDIGIPEGSPLTVTYEVTNGETYGSIKGYTARETVRILVMSNNLDTIRLLDIIVKAALIILRGTRDESSTYQMNDISYTDISPAENLPETPGMIFGRYTDVEYTISYGVDSVVSDFIDDIKYKQLIKR